MLFHPCGLYGKCHDAQGLDSGTFHRKRHQHLLHLPELFQETAQSDSVKRVYGRMFAYNVPAMIDGKPCSSNLISQEENQFRWAEASLLAGSIDAAAEELNQVLIVSEDADLAGSTIILSIDGKEHAVTVAGVLSDSPWHGTRGQKPSSARKPPSQLSQANRDIRFWTYSSKTALPKRMCPTSKACFPAVWCLPTA